MPQSKRPGLIGHRRLLVVVSSDYGELGAALYFLEGLGLDTAPRILLPPALAQALGTGHGLDVHLYRSLSEIRGHLAAARADTLLLASGYLLTVDNSLSVAEVWQLARQARGRGLAILTTDPFLGLHPWPAWPGARQCLHPDGRLALVVWVYLLGLSARVALLRLVLQRDWHVYPAPTNRLPSLAGPQRLSYGGAALAEAPQTDNPHPPDGPIWLFVLSRLDHALQVRKVGADFLPQLLSRLQECMGLGRRVVLIGPPALVLPVRAHFGANPALEAISDVPHPRYIAWLLACEYAFFWNILSFSLIHRVRALRPAFFFDTGHFAQLFPAVAIAGERLFYDGWQPALRALAEPLDLQGLADAAPAVIAAFAQISAGLDQGPAAADVLAATAASSPG